MNIELMEKFRNLVISHTVINKIKDELEIDKAIKSLSNVSPYNILTAEEIQRVRKIIHTENLITLDKGVGLIKPYEYEKWFLNRKKDLGMDFWERYKQYLINDKHFAKNVVNAMDDVSDELTDLLGDPTSNSFQRRGLIIGDVQSGKTANYSGLICKAADAGYKVIVLLTGTGNKLRNQTQLRIDEAFTGRDSDFMIKQKEDVYVGAGNYNPRPGVFCLTSKQSDFSIAIAKNLGITLEKINMPVLFVIKKNVKILKTLNTWLKTLNANGINKINEPLIMIDDESDNASINTKSEDEDPTKTNGLIVEMLNMFSKASYVGFTATPFANIFIEPDSDEDMEMQNLFPKDYVYSLEAPNNYIGARNIFYEKAKHEYMLRLILDGDIYYPIYHKKDDIFSDISPSLKEAINTFLLSNAIRDLRGDTNTHRSMLVNISRFVNIQNQIYSLINDYLKDIQNSIKLYSKLDNIDALKDNNLLTLHEIYEKEFSDLEYGWKTIQEQLYSSTVAIKVLEVNKNKNELNYEENEQNGLRVIAVGGIALSRGLTLEGLMVSYFYRNSQMYDTLMQMGRWFGYRKNYEDICRIWMNQENIDWYSHISEVSDELRKDVKRMKEIGATPSEFGFKIRNHPDTLLITARNKMRHTNRITRNISLSQEIVETPYLYNDKIKNEINFKNVNSFISEVKLKGINVVKTDYPDRYGYKDVPMELIINLLRNSIFPVANSKFDSDTIAKFIENYHGQELEKWDVVFVSGRSKKMITFDGFSYAKVERSYDTVPTTSNEFVRLNKSKIRIGNPTDPKIYLTGDNLHEIETAFNKNHGYNKTINSKFYFMDGIKRNPLLMIYCIDLITKDGEEYPIDNFGDQPLIGFGLGFPFLSDVKTKYAEYTVNKIFESLGMIEETEEELGE